MTTGLLRGALGELVRSVRIGYPGFERAYGMPMWRYVTEHNPAAGVEFDAAMTQASTIVNPSIAQAPDLGIVRSVVDIGGGQGGLLRALLVRHPHIEQAILFDRPTVIDQVRAATGHTCDGRIEVVGGTSFRPFPPARMPMS